MNFDLQAFTSRAGLVGTAILLLGVLVAAVTFRGEYGDTYSFLNHNISELGKVGGSRFAWVFNLSLILGGLLLAVFMVGLGVYLRHWGAYLIAVVGMVAGIVVCFVGIFPTDVLEPHYRAAATFFFSGMVSMIFFTGFVLLTNQDELAKWLAVPSALSALSFAAFLFVPQWLYPDDPQRYFSGHLAPNRPLIWLPSLLEWTVLIVFTAWVIIVSLYLQARGN